jgi:predicted nucleotidyltransferase
MVKRVADGCDALGSTAGEGYDMVRMQNSVKKQIRHMVRRIVADFDPDQIILFGSHARGQAGPDSDVDLLVVMPVEGSKRAKQLEIRTAVRDIHVPKDIIVSRPEEFQWRKDTVGTIEHPAAKEGEVLYARK